jgi:hypothetical protein
MNGGNASRRDQSQVNMSHEYRSIARSIFGGVHEGEPYDLITSCSDVDFLKSYETESAIGLIHDSY